MIPHPNDTARAVALLRWLACLERDADAAGEGSPAAARYAEARCSQYPLLRELLARLAGVEVR
jgi:hypothetical protein